MGLRLHRAHSSPSSLSLLSVDLTASSPLHHPAGHSSRRSRCVRGACGGLSVELVRRRSSSSAERYRRLLSKAAPWLASTIAYSFSV